MLAEPSIDALEAIRNTISLHACLPDSALRPRANGLVLSLSVVFTAISNLFGRLADEPSQIKRPLVVTVVAASTVLVIRARVAAKTSPTDSLLARLILALKVGKALVTRH